MSEILLLITFQYYKIIPVYKGNFRKSSQNLDHMYANVKMNRRFHRSTTCKFEIYTKNSLSNLKISLKKVYFQKKWGLDLGWIVEIV